MAEVDLVSASARKMAELVKSMGQTDLDRLRDSCRLVVEGRQKGNATDAIFLLKAIGDREASMLEEERRIISGLGLEERVRRSFTIEPMTETERKLIQVLLDNPGSSSGGLSDKCGYGGMSWHLHFGMMCQRRQTSLVPPPLSARKLPSGRAADFWSGVLADYNEASGWTMKAEVVQALASLGMRGRGQ